jgi:phosphatidate cytidylyltransferase
VDLKKLAVRSLVGVIFGPLILLSAWQGGLLFLMVILSIVLLGTLEFYNMANQKLASPQRIIGVLAGLGICVLAFFNMWNYLWILFTAVTILILIVELFRGEIAPILNIATTLMPLIYVALLIGFLILIRELPAVKTSATDAVAGHLVIFVFVTIWICDSAAYILGSRFGKHKLFPRVSPNKTVEGTIFGFIFALLTAFGYHQLFLTDIALLHIITLGAISGSFAQISDLIESLLKRDAGVKDSSSIIPGHGGILDRFDSEILVAPVVYFYLFYIVF